MSGCCKGKCSCDSTKKDFEELKKYFNESVKLMWPCSGAAADKIIDLRKRAAKYIEK